YGRGFAKGLKGGRIFTFRCRIPFKSISYFHDAYSGDANRIGGYFAQAFSDAAITAEKIAWNACIEKISSHSSPKILSRGGKRPFRNSLKDASFGSGSKSNIAAGHCGWRKFWRYSRSASRMIALRFFPVAALKASSFLFKSGSI